MDGKDYQQRKVMRIDDINAMADADIRENEINKLAEEVYGKDVNQDYEEGFVDGYNKAKETLYTKEQMLECWNTSIIDVTTFETFIELLKYPKK
jgi:flagellar biosynthesis/type III secretory pathway protein FliH